MATRVSARLSAAEGRRFGLTVGAACGALGGAWWWRGHQTGAVVALAVGVLLVLAGAIIPTRVAPVHAGWMRLAEVMSSITTPVFLGVMYFLVLTPTAWIRRVFGGTSLARNAGARTYWVPRDPEHRQSNLERQF